MVRPTAMDVEVSGDVCTYYVFVLEDELYALDIFKIKEIKVGYQDQIKSVIPINFFIIGGMERGQEIVPIIDLPLRLGIKEMQNQSQARTIIVVETVLNKQKRKFGMLVDSVLNVTNIRTQDIMNTSLYKPDIKQYFILNRFSE